MSEISFISYECWQHYLTQLTVDIMLDCYRRTEVMFLPPESESGIIFGTMQTGHYIGYMGKAYIFDSPDWASAMPAEFNYALRDNINRSTLEEFVKLVNL